MDAMARNESSNVRSLRTGRIGCKFGRVHERDQFGVAWLQLRCPVIMSDGFTRMIGLAVHHPQHHVRHAMVRLLLHDGIQQPQSLIHLARLNQSDATLALQIR